jgi:hypothetical protein
LYRLKRRKAEGVSQSEMRNTGKWVHVNWNSPSRLQRVRLGKEWKKKEWKEAALFRAHRKATCSW